MESHIKKHLVCKKPFEWLEITSGPGKLAYLCCPAFLDTPTGSASKKQPRDTWSNSVAQQLRASCIDGSFRYCDKKSCPDYNQKSGPVVYVDDNELARLKALTYNTEALQNKNFGPKFLNCAYDRSCNLSCPSCRNELLAINKEQRLNNYAMLEAYLEEFSSSLEMIYITGSGDAFGSRHFWDVLSGDLLMKYPKIKLLLHTNAQLLTPERWDKIAHLHSRIANLEVSVDAASCNTYAENRRGGDWQTLLHNMTYIGGQKQRGLLSSLKTSFVVQSNNWLEMKTFVNLSRNWHSDKIFFAPLRNWGTFSTSEFRTRAVHLPHHQHYKKFIEWLNSSFFNAEDIQLGALNQFRSRIAAIEIQED